MLIHDQACATEVRRARKRGTLADAEVPRGHQRARVRGLRRLRRQVALPVVGAGADRVRAQDADRPDVVQHRPVVHRRRLPGVHAGRRDRSKRAPRSPPPRLPVAELPRAGRVRQARRRARAAGRHRRHRRRHGQPGARHGGTARRPPRGRPRPDRSQPEGGPGRLRRAAEHARDRGRRQRRPVATPTCCWGSTSLGVGDGREPRRRRPAADDRRRLDEPHADRRHGDRRRRRRPPTSPPRCARSTTSRAPTTTCSSTPTICRSPCSPTRCRPT